MSELINNKEKKQAKLKAIIKKLHDGATVEDVKAEFDKLTIGVSSAEIVEMEQALVDEGLAVEEIQRLCDVHASVFKGAIEDIHNDDPTPPPALDKWHPINTFKKENRAIEDIIENKILISLENSDKDGLISGLKELSLIDKHYVRKENLIFPIMEKFNITAPPQVMWGVDDEIRQKIKDITNWIVSSDNISSLDTEVRDLTTQVNEMIFKEEEIMTPMIMDVFTQDEWSAIENSSSEIGYVYIGKVQPWTPSGADIVPPAPQAPQGAQAQYVATDSDSKISFDAGKLTAKEINSILNTVPIDMTFVGADNRVKYFTQGKERVFPRPITIIGREVKHCHPPKSVHIVESIVEDLRSGKKDNEDFWIRMGDKFVYIRYFAVRDKQGEFLGTLEVSQDIKSITELEGEKRLVSD